MRAAAFFVSFVVSVALFARVHASCIHDQLNHVQVVTNHQQYSGSSNGPQVELAPKSGSEASLSTAQAKESEEGTQVQVQVNPDFLPRRDQREHEEL